MRRGAGQLGREEPAPPGDTAHRPQPTNLTGALTALQRSVGNRKVNQLLTEVQRDVPKRQPHQIPTVHDIAVRAEPLAKEMGTALDRWKAQAYWGIQNFVNEELEHRIDKLRSAGLSTDDFVQALLGNLIWAGACFIPGSPALAFIMSTTGIGITARTAPPNKVEPADKGGVSRTAERVQTSLDHIEEEIRGKSDTNLLGQAKNLVLFNQDMPPAALLELALSQYFDASMRLTGPEGKLTRLNDQVVKTTQKEALVTRFQHFVAAVTLVGGKTEAETVLGRKIGGEHTLSLIAVAGIGGDGPGSTQYGIGYEVTPRVTALDGKMTRPGEIAIAQWVADDTVNDVLERESKMKIFPLIIKANATEVKMGPDPVKAHEAALRERSRQGSLRPG